MINYHAPKWLPGGHTQTLYPLLIKPRPLNYWRERWETPDNDFIDLDWNEAPYPEHGENHTPLVVLFHGLEGSSNSHYAITLMLALSTVGWSGVVVHFRGCSGVPNRLPRAYHSGDSDEIDWILRRFKQNHPNRSLFVVGVSLGGNALLKWLGEREASATSLISAAAAISAPIDLTACGHNLGHGFNRVYTRHFLQTLKPNSATMLKRFPGLFDPRLLHEAKSLYEFDNVITAPLHGFKNTDDYWRRASSKPWLNCIGVPTLVLNAQNDPFLPHSALPRTDQVSSCVTLDFPREGGHVGFVSGSFPGQLDWLPQRLLHYFKNGR
ncbi:MAG: hydrolase [Betaproteobacteria bacterium]